MCGDSPSIEEGKPEDWNEDRIDQIGQNGNEGEHYGVHVDDITPRPDLAALIDMPIASKPKDTGKHYRHSIKVKVTQADVDRGYVEVQLDPFRIARVYRMSCQAMFTMLKKVLRAGTGGHKDLRKDLDDIENAIIRKRQMMDEDEHCLME